MPENKNQEFSEILRKSRQRVKYALVIMIFSSVVPFAIAGFYMTSLFQDAYVWRNSRVLTLLAGLLVAWFVGARLMNKMMDTMQSFVRSESQLRMLMELSGDWYWQNNTEHVITRIILRGQEQYQHDPDPKLPFMGLARWDVEGLKCIDTRYSWETFRELLNSRQPFDRVCFEYWPSDRPRLVFESTGRPVYDAFGQYEGYVGVSTDITQKCLNEQLLSLQRSLLQGVLLSAPIAELASSYARGLRNCLTVHSEVILGYRDKSMNDAWRVRGTSTELHLPHDKGQEIWNHPEGFCDPIEGHNQNDLIWLGQIKPEFYFSPAWKDELGICSAWFGMKKALEPHQPEYWILVAQKNIEQIHHDDVLRLLTAIRLLGLCIERRVFEDDLQSLNGTLELRIDERTAQLSKSNAELQAFSYMVSHDLRAPLRAIDGFSNILKEDFSSQLSEEARTLLDRISNNARQMAGLIDGLLDFSRLLRTDVARVDVNLNILVEQVLDQLDAKRKATVRLCDLPFVCVDPVLFKQVWMNLIDNALKFSSKVENPLITIECQKVPKGHMFAVRDNGAGFDMTYKHKLFNVFERLHHKKDFEGTGVGLAIVKRIIERHGGEITAKAELGKGASFFFTLPNVSNE